MLRTFRTIFLVLAIINLTTVECRRGGGGGRGRGRGRRRSGGGGHYHRPVGGHNSRRSFFSRCKTRRLHEAKTGQELISQFCGTHTNRECQSKHGFPYAKVKSFWFGSKRRCSETIPVRTKVKICCKSWLDWYIF